MGSTAVRRKSCFGIALLAAILAFGIALVGLAPQAYAAEKQGPMLQSGKVFAKSGDSALRGGKAFAKASNLTLQDGKVSAQANDVGEILLDRYDPSTGNYDDVGYVYRNGSATQVAGVSYEPTTKTITLNNCNDTMLGLNIDANNCDITIRVVGTCRMNAFWIYGAGVNITGEGTLILNSEKQMYRSIYMSCYYEKPQAKGLHVAGSVTMQLYGRSSSDSDAGCIGVYYTTLSAGQAVRFDGLVSPYSVKTDSYDEPMNFSSAYYYDETDEDYYLYDLCKLNASGATYYGYYDDWDEDWTIFEVAGTHDGLPVVEYCDTVEDVNHGPEGYTVLDKLPAKDHIVSNVELKQDRRGISTGATAVVGGATYKVANDAASTVVFQKAPKKAKKVTVPATVTIRGKKYSVVGIAPMAFKGTKAKTAIIKTTKLSKGSVKKCFKGSKVKTVKAPKAKKKAYKKIFKKKVCGKKVKVK